MEILNTDIDFSKLPIPVINPAWAYAADNKDVVLPNNFSWGTITSDDDEAIKSKKRLITTPQRQFQCGSCFAMATATCISDIFVVSGLKWNPMVSTTFLMQNFKGNKCDGGNPATLLMEIASSSGVLSDHCVDYSWCSKNAICNEKESGHFDSEYRKRQQLSKLVTPKGCFFSQKDGMAIPRNLYRIKNVRNIGLSLGPKESERLNLLLKTIIRYKGPIIMGFRVFGNFPVGRFTQINKGVYFDNDISENDNEVKFYEGTLPSPVDKHACVIVGWGVERNVQVNNKGDIKDVPYWHCRNSFGVDWGNNGYFKYAMFPYNQIGSPLSIPGLGGFIAFEANGISQGTFSKTPVVPPILERPDSYYTSSEPTPLQPPLPGPEPPSLPIEKVNNNTTTLVIIVVAVIVILLFLLNKQGW